MAIRRISDLPNVETVTDGNPNIASCLFEVSHRDAEDHNVFKSYYMTGIDVANQVYNDERLSNCVKLSCYPAQTISVAHNFSKGFYLVDTSHPVNAIVKTQNELTNVYPTSTDVLVTPGALLPYLTDTYMKNDALYGHEGEIVYVTPESIKKQTVFRSDIYICENDNDITKSTTVDFSFKEVYESWTKGGYRGAGNWYGYNPYPSNSQTLAGWLAENAANGKYPNSFNQLTSGEFNKPVAWTMPDESKNHYGHDFWAYNDNPANSEKGTIVQCLNSWDYTFYSSPTDYLNYEIELECRSFGNDDDCIGFIAAMNIDKETNLPHTLSFIRSPNNGNFETLQPAFHWYCAIDANRMIEPADTTTNLISNDFSMSATYYGSEYAKNNRYNAKNAAWWNAHPPSKCDEHPDEYAISNFSIVGTTKIYIKREKNMISAETTPFGSDTYSSRFVIDLNNLSDVAGNSYEYFDTTNYPRGSKIGFAAMSQGFTNYKIIQAKLPKTLIDTRSNSLSVYDPITNIWEKSSELPTSYVGIGRMVKNPITNKTFYTADTSFIKVASFGTEDWKFTIQNGASVEEITKKVMVEQ